MNNEKRNASSRLSTPFQRDANLVIAGGGITGMVAARLARSAGLSVIVLEADDILGGNARAGSLPEGTPYPKGSTLLCTYDEEQRDFLKHLGVELSPQHRVFPDRVFVDGEWLNLWSEDQDPTTEFEAQIAEFAAHCEQILRNEQGEVALTVHDLPQTALDWDKRSFSEAFADLPPKLKRTLETILRSDAACGGSQVSALASMVDLVTCLRGKGFVLPGGNHAIVQALRDGTRGTAPITPLDVRTKTRLVGVSEGESQVVARVQDTATGLYHSLGADHVLLAMPSQAVVNLPGVNLNASAKKALFALSHAPYTMVHLFLDYCPLESHVFHMSPGTQWVTDVLQINAHGDRSVPLGADIASVLTAYVPGAAAAELGSSDPARLLNHVRSDIGAMFPGNRRLREAIDRAPVDVTQFRQAMSAPAPGQVSELRHVDRHPSRRVHYAHSDLAFFSALGAIEVARRTMAQLLDGKEHPLLRRLGGLELADRVHAVRAARATEAGALVPAGALFPLLIERPEPVTCGDVDHDRYVGI